MTPQATDWRVLVEEASTEMGLLRLELSPVRVDEQAGPSPLRFAILL